jgi:glycosyltransferase involved in cell wall biosynthesis
MDPISRPQIYVIIPAYNEGRVIFRVVSEVSRAATP